MDTGEVYIETCLRIEKLFTPGIMSRWERGMRIASYPYIDKQTIILREKGLWRALHHNLVALRIRSQFN